MDDATTITRVTATCHRVPIDVPLLDRPMIRPFVAIEVETSAGIVGHGLTSGTPHLVSAIARFVTDEAGPHVVGTSVLAIERLGAELARRFNKRALNGVWSSGVSGIDIAAWDARAQHLGAPLALLLGGASDRVPAYVTFGLAEYTRDELTELAKRFVDDGFTRLKMVVGAGPDRHAEGSERWSTAWREDSRQHLHHGTDLRRDVERVAAVRAAVGPDVELMVDANCGFTLADAKRFAAAVADLDLAWFEEPIRGNDVAAMRDLRSVTSIPVSAGQNLGHLWDHQRLIAAGAADILQPNVCFVGGYTGALHVAALARAANLPLANGGGWPHHNLPFQAAVPNGGPVEFHWSAWKLGELLYDHPPGPVDGWVTPSPEVGLGLRPDPDVLAEHRADH